MTTKNDIHWAIEQFKSGRAVYRKVGKHECCYDPKWGDQDGLFDTDDLEHVGWYTKPEQLTLPFVDMEHGKL